MTNILRLSDETSRSVDPGDSTLHSACARGDEFLVKAPINAVNKKGWAPIHYAQEYAYTEVFNLLREGGAGDVLDRPLRGR